MQVALAILGLMLTVWAVYLVAGMTAAYSQVVSGIVALLLLPLNPAILCLGAGCMVVLLRLRWNWKVSLLPLAAFVGYATSLHKPTLHGAELLLLLASAGWLVLGLRQRNCGVIALSGIPVATAMVNSTAAIPMLNAAGICLVALVLRSYRMKRLA